MMYNGKLKKVTHIRVSVFYCCCFYIGWLNWYVSTALRHLSTNWFTLLLQLLWWHCMVKLICILVLHQLRRIII